ncbi:glycosyltransferase family 2 protein [Schlesneria sp.]|uniref:glycosyltransferase family 2 protein n=1 Tax=Schlesneria sp. TaxID=2762018 RepID=UPI002F1BB5FE
MDKDFSFSLADIPVAQEYLSSYLERVATGRQRMARSRAVICGLARNVEKILPKSIARIERLGTMFADYRVVIYENDSTDNTKPLLQEWAQANPKVDITVEQLGDPVNPCARCLKRAERMARYRNECLNLIREKYADYDHVIVVDTDLEYGWSDDGVANTFGHENWDFVGSNGLILRRCGIALNAFLQYDAWAFRNDENFTQLSTAEVNYMSWQRGEPLVPVMCSFGGLGVYRMPAYLAGTYSGHDTEHVTHQQVARPLGFRNVFLNPSQITLYGRHHRRSDLWMIPLITVGTRILESARLVAAPCISRTFVAATHDREGDSRTRRFGLPLTTNH